ncbi:hypothetical protein PQH03_27690 [Ralstonia insidiosa]|jgi:hypothetical protein|uniref:DUF1845 domain-containing protein n=1 Tax=Ralstonia insidiosa TaxID=190721 RepID=A0A192A7M7_9RALS|nr:MULTISPECIES: hypothetical protein [Ralstonia]KMW44795.1 hypothetical protein AC240_22800 [Ralstonia sp. MD27]ANJ76343.1 hypothetical protein A9Y76_27460 [Ralstonia insidiosa]MBA9869805.1 hypothetical protein [Ralstonia insidiosa]MBA9913487.1 hypothetical protein [Ralstonia insidiosa]MBA9952801.1 hypothetical protein [Ralstonia insidiosa]
MTTAENVNLLRPTVTESVAEFAREAFGRQMRGAVAMEPVEFCSTIVQSIVRREYLLLNKNISFTIDAPRTLPRFDTTACDEIDDLFKKKIGDTIVYVDNLTKQLWALFENNSETPAAEFPGMLKQDLPYVSPRVKEYIKLLRRADEYLKLIWAAYLAGLVSARDRHSAEIAVRKRLRSISNLARDVKFRMYKQFNAWQAAEKARLPAGSSAAATAGSAHTGDESVETDATEEGATASATDEAISVAPASTEAHSHAEAA